MKSRLDFGSEQKWLDYLRIYLAALAMQSFCVNENEYPNPATVAEKAVRMADALIEELNKKVETK